MSVTTHYYERSATHVEQLRSNPYVCELHSIRFCADRLLRELKQPTIYNVTNPFPWMDIISLHGKTNFFEKRVSEYRNSGVNTTSDPKHHVFSLDETTVLKHATSPI
jgi:hypothetical protein